MRKQHMERAAAILSLLVLILAWAGGRARLQESATAHIQNISNSLTNISQVSEHLYRADQRNAPDAPLHIALASRPSYGGPLKVALAADGEGTIRHVAIISSTDTATYLAKVVENGILDPFPGNKLDKLPDVDAVSGATISSTAILGGLKEAAARIAAARKGEPMPAQGAPGPVNRKEIMKSMAIVLLFGCALFVAGRRFPWSRKKGRAALLTVSTLLLGILYSTQFSLATVHLLISGGWTQGLASYAALVCFILAVAVFFLTRKNLYCATLCPFGAVQEGLGRITGCSPPKRTPWMTWSARLVALAALCAALFFRNPSQASFEPFGMAFNFTGSDALFAMTLAVVMGSLMVKRPWCRLFCPVTALFDYIGFVRNQWRRRTVKDIRPKEAP
ncbi:FMN-binding protein [Desulfoluna spongiiphila]|uniref:4Fe-4S binding domain-containing protein n=1 Tax=Desulfoluna spongiiphila TaxID=419481 RepID=A0A1G5HWE1_9BACT|nr:4Fe-4S binding protein [Desulfoluna spongiiphila]SCY68106.1 4Fe-4S binding domain-containing protein [Desulfoluna spongiiphila]